MNKPTPMHITNAAGDNIPGLWVELDSSIAIKNVCPCCNAKLRENCVYSLDGKQVSVRHFIHHDRVLSVAERGSH